MVNNLLKSTKINKTEVSKVSVIVPVYNVQDHLESCLNSIINQTYLNLEIILVDDGSTDNSSDICDKYGEKDARIVVLHKRNGGQSDARNAGIDICTGAYITFIDSDDYVEKDFISTLYQTALEHKSEISTCRYRMYNPSEGLPFEKAGNNVLALTSEDALENLCYQKNTTTSACMKLYKKELFSDIRYPVGKNCEDLGTTYRLFSKSNRVVINSAAKYFYLQRPGSLVHVPFSLDRMDGLKFAEDQLKFVKIYHPKIIRAAQNRLFMEAMYISLRLLSSKQQYPDEYKRCQGYILKYRVLVFTDIKSTLKTRTFAGLTLLGLINPMAIFQLNKFFKKLGRA